MLHRPMLTITPVLSAAVVTVGEHKSQTTGRSAPVDFMSRLPVCTARGLPGPPSLAGFGDISFERSGVSIGSWISTGYWWSPIVIASGPSPRTNARIRRHLPSQPNRLADQSVQQQQGAAQETAAEHHVRDSGARADLDASVLAGPQTSRLRPRCENEAVRTRNRPGVPLPLEAAMGCPQAVSGDWRLATEARRGSQGRRRGSGSPDTLVRPR